MSSFARALSVAVFALIAYQFSHVGALALLLAIKLSLAHDGGGLVAAFAASVFIWVGLISLRALRQVLQIPPLT